MALLFLFVIFLFPVALYCSLLAAINRRASPLMVSGGWDFAGLLFAMSGFFLVSGPFLAALFYQQSIADFLLRRGGQALSKALLDVLGDRVIYWSLYYGVILSGAVFFLWWRSKSTVIYNVQPEVLENVLGGILEGKHLAAKRLGKRIYFGVAPEVEGNPRPIDPGTAHVVLDSFPLFWNVTLTWRGEGAAKWREEIETELQKALAAIFSEENPSSGWLFLFSALLFLVMIFTTALVIVFSILFPRR